MFGYIVVHKPELKVKEYETYRASYCGLCHSLKKQSGRIGQLTLSFDMTFLALLLTGLYEPETVIKSARCIAHPVEKHFYRENRYFDYAADMNVLLTYYKCLDDWQDERKLTACLFGQALKGNVKKLAKDMRDRADTSEIIWRHFPRMKKKNSTILIKLLDFLEQLWQNCSCTRKDEWAEKLRRMGFYFGKFIYLMDAYEDIEEDLKQGRYNPFTELYKKETFEQDCQQILKMMMAETSKVFEQLPILEDAEILRNILYAGVWTRYGQIRCRRKETKKEA